MIKENEFYIHKRGCTIVHITCKRKYYYKRDYYTWYVTYISNDNNYSLHSNDIGKTFKLSHWDAKNFNLYYVKLDEYEEYKKTKEYKRYYDT